VAASYIGGGSCSSPGRNTHNLYFRILLKHKNKMNQLKRILIKDTIYVENKCYKTSSF
jgi:hypothetical protein